MLLYKPGQFLITGSARSGTSWMASILSHLVPCTHEGVFKTDNRLSLDSWVGGEVSFAAVPWLDQVQCPIFHQVRHPLKVIRSEASHLTRDKGNSQAETLYPDLQQYDVLSTAIEYYIRQNRAIEKYASEIFQVEKVDPCLIEDLLGIAGYKDVLCPYWLTHLPPSNTNPTPVTRLAWEITWEDIPEKYYFGLYDMAIRYGYEE